MNSASHFLHINGEEIPIVVRRHPSSRRMVIRYQPLQNFIALTLPRYVAIRQGLDFVSSKYDWILRQRESHPPVIAFADGCCIPVQGVSHTLRYVGGRGVVQVQAGELWVHGAPEFMARRVEAWLKERARQEITQLAHEKAAQLGTRISRITLRDNSSCWGSCTSGGRLSFSWRLILAEPEILNYVVCHEVAHLLEHNHSQRFWRLVESLCPHWRASREWLKQHGKLLYAYGER